MKCSESANQSVNQPKSIYAKLLGIVSGPCSEDRLSIVKDLIFVLLPPTLTSSNPFLIGCSPRSKSPISLGWNQFIHTSTQSINMPSKMNMYTSVEMRDPSLPWMYSTTRKTLRTQIRVLVTYSVMRYDFQRTWGSLARPVGRRVMRRWKTALTRTKPLKKKSWTKSPPMMMFSPVVMFFISLDMIPAPRKREI